MEEKKILVSAKGLMKSFKVKNGTVKAVGGVDIDIYKGETLALVGESGCGKSTLGRLLLRLIEPTSGTVLFDGKDITKMKNKEMREMRREMQIVFQDPYSSIDPRFSVRRIISEPLKAYKIFSNKGEQEEYIRELVQKVGIHIEDLDRYPHQFSGGQRQRMGIARALALKPQLIVCDEPVSALDVSIQAQTLNLLHDLQDEFNLTYLFISHDLAVVRYISNRVCVMFLGKICEVGDTEDIYSNPKHPYTYFLLSSTPNPDPTKRKQDKEILSGEAPSPVNPPSGCHFHTRCPYAQDICSQKEPEPRMVDGRIVACHFPLNEK
ncbi:MAG: ATP-binding cassette domain-containing protein [Clostridiales bacterium]|nr:ATP-binding cassette domain-containing protein [Clostridiales bacterium]MDD7143280.1 ATP-binding cassette domain-containing protein [bacterium]MDY5457623.1 oligopeptide/dipeptide ABC transporter ATP-binding protein [Bariatricus sp.]